MKNYNNISSFDQLIEVEHGKIGTESRNKYEENSQMFIISEMLKDARKEAKITQEQLAEKTGTKKSYISRIENNIKEVRISTLQKIVELDCWNETFIAAAQFHPSRDEYYIKKAIDLNLALPEFNYESPTFGKIILSSKVEKVLGYSFKKPNL